VTYGQALEDIVVDLSAVGTRGSVVAILRFSGCQLGPEKRHVPQGEESNLESMACATRGVVLVACLARVRKAEFGRL